MQNALLAASAPPVVSFYSKVIQNALLAAFLYFATEPSRHKNFDVLQTKVQEGRLVINNHKNVA